MRICTYDIVQKEATSISSFQSSLCKLYENHTIGGRYLSGDDWQSKIVSAISVSNESGLRKVLHSAISFDISMGI
jgi:hypothetical protein